MAWFSFATDEDTAVKGTLTRDERAALVRLEAVVDAGVQVALTMIEAGRALAELRDRQLYRDSATSWQEYVETRFKITKRRCDQLIAFSAVRDVLEGVSSQMGTAVPTLGERASRPLVGLPAETITEIVTEAAGSEEGVTAGSIRKAASRRKAKASRTPRPRRFRVPGATVAVTFNRKSTGSVIEALEAAIRQAQAGEAEAA